MNGAPLFVENLQKETPCDCAEKTGHGEIALYLESKMVFSVSKNLLLYTHSVLVNLDSIKYHCICLLLSCGSHV